MESSAEKGGTRLPLPCKTLVEAAEMLRAREVSSEALTQAVLDRINQHEGTLHAYAYLMTESALAEARTADAQIAAAGTTKGPLHGIPVAVKDLFAVAGVPNAAGCKALLDNVPEEDCTVVQRLRAAGAIILGKLNTTEGMYGGYSELLGLEYVPLNPWNIEMWSGNSSSGSGVATAAGMAFATLGSDTLGSVRYPVNACGVVGLKPTWGRCSVAGCIPFVPSLDHVGVLARCTADAAVMIQVIAGPDPKDASCVQQPAPELFTEGAEWSLLLDLPEDKSIRVGFDRTFNGPGESIFMDEELLASVESALAILVSATGAIVVECQMPTPDDLPGTYPLVQHEALQCHTEMGRWPSRADEYGASFRSTFEGAETLSEERLAKKKADRARLVEQIRAVFAENALDVLITPGHCTPAVPLEPENPRGAGDNFKLPNSTRFMEPFDLTGHPTLTVPCGVSSSGLPFTFQIVGQHLQECLLCKLGHAYEGAVGRRRLPLLPPL